MQASTATTVAALQQKTKEVFSEDVINASPFAKELYKQVRNKVKKLDDIQKAEEKLKEKGAKITEDQSEKLKNKQSFIQSVQQQIEAFEVYKRTEFVLIQQRLAAAAEEVPKVEVVVET